MFFRTKKVFISSRATQQKRKRRAIQSLTFFLFFVGCIGLLGFVSWRPEMNISRITILGNSTLAEEDIRGFLEKKLTGGYAYVFSRANVFLFQPQSVEKELREQFQKIKEVDVSRENLTSVIVTLTERKPYYLWCDLVVVATDDDAQKESCYFLDIDGLAFAPAPYFSGNVYFTFEKSFGEESPIGRRLFDEGEFKRFISFRNALREMNLEASTLQFAENGDSSFVLTRGGVILFHSQQDFTVLADSLRVTFDAEQFIKKQKSGHDLEYIDLRFDNKVYYRFE